MMFKNHIALKINDIINEPCKIGHNDLHLSKEKTLVIMIQRTSDTSIGHLPIFQMLPKTSIHVRTRYYWYKTIDILETNKGYN